MCGEKPMLFTNSTPFLGSPPHVRGKDSRSHFGDVYGGITPACAGKSYGFGVINVKELGSPPHVRGKD